MALTTQGKQSGPLASALFILWIVLNGCIPHRMEPVSVLKPQALFYDAIPMLSENRLRPINYPNIWEDGKIDLVLVGHDHPFYPQDNKIMSNNGKALVESSPFFELMIPFSSGQQLLEHLQLFTEFGLEIGNVCLLGHSGYEGYFVSDLSGFHRDGYVFKRAGKVQAFNQEVAFVSDLKLLVDQGKIVFSPSSVIVLAGCNTAYKEDGFAYQLEHAIQRPIIAATDKIDVYHVGTRGEDLRGDEKGTFLLLEYKNGAITSMDFQTKYLRITQAMEAYINYKKNVKTN